MSKADWDEFRRYEEEFLRATTPKPSHALEWFLASPLLLCIGALIVGGLLKTFGVA